MWAAARAAPPPQAPPVRLGVASSVADLVESLLSDAPDAPAWELVAASSGRLAQQLEAGAPFDAVLLASDALMDRLAAGGHIVSTTRCTVAGNRLVLARRSGAASDPAKATALRLALAEPETVPLGHYTRQALLNRGLQTPLPPARVFGASAAQVLGWLVAGEADLAVVYASDLVRANAGAAAARLEAVEHVAPTAHDPVRYPAAAAARAHDPAAARALLAHLCSPRAAARFAAAGFEPPTLPAPAPAPGMSQAPLPPAEATRPAR